MSQSRTRLRAFATLAGLVLAIGGIGAGVALAVAHPRDRALNEISALRATINRQNQQVTDIRADAHRDINALAVKLGDLQAQAVRLDALGQRLTQAGKLDAKEFNFQQPPSVGGPEEPGETSYALPQRLSQDINTLGVKFDRQQSQLGALEDLLLDRKLASNLRPTGMPVHTGYISSYFGPRTDPFNGRSEFHEGLDIATPVGTPVHAVAEGVVTYAGLRTGYGKVVEVDHGNGYMTRFAHNSKLLVHPGERVHIGQVLSMSGDTGRSTGPHVHFEVWFKGRPVNPLAYVRSHR